jgi:ubiquinone/menaquinone biosynthesis C-methylase UbiE
VTVGGFADPRYVCEQYASEKGLAARKAAYRQTTGLDARDVLFEAIAEAKPTDVLEVGCGEGELAERIVRELGASLVALDQSERMVELARARDIDARIGDVQELPFVDASFDVVVAAWMLYHVASLDRGLGEIARVLRPGGRLVAATNYTDHLYEMFELVGAESWELPFSGENGTQILERTFARVERREASGTVTFADTDAVRRYLASSIRLRGLVDAVPQLNEPLVATRRPVVLVAER